MPHLLKSPEPSPFAPPPPPSPDAKVLEFRRPRRKERFPSQDSQDALEWGETEEDLISLRLQVAEIIDSILAETGPEEAEVREQLRRHVANHPGHPEKALLKHLLNLSS